MIRTNNPKDFSSKGKSLINNKIKPETTPINVPEGYMVGEEFWMEVKADLKKLYQENGLLQQRGSK